MDSGAFDDGTQIMPACNILVGGKPVSVLVDSGSPYTMIGDKNWECIFPSEEIVLQPSDINPAG